MTPDRPIDKEILDALGISQDQIASADPIARQERRVLRRIEQFGEDHYRTITHHDYIDLGGMWLFDSGQMEAEGIHADYLIDVKDVYYYREPLRRITEYTPESRRQRLADNLEKAVIKQNQDLLYKKYGRRGRAKSIFEQIPEEFLDKPETKTQMEKVRKVLSAFLKGFGLEAADNGEWVTAINALDVATQGDIFADQTIFFRLRDMAQADPAAGSIIARLIQERKNQNPNPPTSASS